MISVSDLLRVRFFGQSLTGPAFGWYASLAPDSIRTWRQLEDQFHTQYHSEAAEAGIADLAPKSNKSEERPCQNTYNASGRSRTDATRRASQRKR
jgi:hypothetical protein